jgi:shikimate dehydrogenase
VSPATRLGMQGSEDADARAAGATRLGVLGWPVAHSRSPAIHNAALAELGLTQWHYQRLPVPPELFEETARALGGAGFRGANVTIPHKQAALAVADEASAAARAIGAANTLSFAPGGGIAAENTDAPGLLAALARAGCDPRDRTAQILGAGGSARAAAWALREAGAREVAVWNRTPARAEELGRALRVRTVAGLPEKADILINCTSVGLKNDGPGSAAASGRLRHPRLVPPATEGESDLNKLGLTHDLLGEYSYVVDLVYTQGRTPLLAAAREVGAATVDGLEVLVAQGALSLEVWTGQAAPLEVMRRAGRSPIGRAA